MLALKTQLEFETADEVSLVHAAKEGNLASFEQLIKRHTDMAFRVAMHILACPEEAEEVVQESFLRAFQNLSSFEERAQFSTWLTRIVVNSSLMKLRTLGRFAACSVEGESDDAIAVIDRVTDWRPNPEQLYREGERREILLRALAALPEGLRVVFLLRDVEGFSTAETAEMLELNLNVVESSLLRARLRLRARLSTHFERGDSESLPLQQIQSDLPT